MATQKVTPIAVAPQPSPRVESVTQDSLAEIISLRQQIETLEKQLGEVQADVQSALAAGAAVEEGTHIADLKEAFRRNVAWREVAERLGDRLYGEGQGEGYCQRVLAATKPARTVSLHVQ
jgi:hypothetical protein